MGKIGENPSMIIVALDEQDRKDYLKRGKLIKSYIKNLKQVHIFSEKELLKELEKI